MTKKRENSFSVFSKYSVLTLGLFKVISTIIFITSYKLHDFFYPFTAFAFPFGFAVFYDTELVAKHGKVMVISFFALTLMWILFFVLLLLKKTAVVKIGFALFITLNCVDIACAVWSLMYATLMLVKIINVLFSVLLIAFTVVVFVKQRKIVE